MAQLWKIRLPNGNVLTPGDWTSAEPLYSTVEIAAGAFPLLTAFSYSRGGSVPGSVGPRDALLIDTNLEGEGNRLPENEELICFTLGVEAFKTGAKYNDDRFPDADAPNMPLDDMLRLQRDLVIKFKIAAVKNYTHSPMSYWPSGTGVHQYMSGGRTRISAGVPTGEILGNNGDPAVTGARHLASPLYVAGGESMSVDISAGPGSVLGLFSNESETVETGDTRARLRIYLDGYRRRPVA
jgi:hypothetical protein